MKAKRIIQRINEFHCCDKVFSRPDFMVHLTNEHGFVKRTQCNRSLLQALDGSDFYSNTYQWEIQCGDKTIKVTEVDSGPRAKGDLLSMGEE